MIHEDEMQKAVSLRRGKDRAFSVTKHADSLPAGRARNFVDARGRESNQSESDDGS